MSQKDAHKQKTYHVEALVPDVSDIVKGWMGQDRLNLNEDDVKKDVKNDAQLQQFFDQVDVRKRRGGLDSQKLKEEGAKRQKRQANSKINTDLKYAIINKHDAKKRKRKKGILVDYGEHPSDEEKEEQQEDKQVPNPEPVTNDDDDDEELGKSAKFTKRAGKSRDIINRATNLIQSYTTNKSEKPSKKKRKHH
jgi:hypothetical protein